MSESDDDIESLGSKSKTKQTRNTRERQPVGSSNSKKPTSKAGSRAKGKSVPEPSESGVEEILPEEGEVPAKSNRGRRAVAATSHANSQQNSKGQSKAKVLPAKVSKKSQEIELIDDTDAEALADSLINAINPNTRPIRKDEREITRLRRQLEEAQSRITNLTKQLEELFRTRHTEAEKLLHEVKEHYEAQLQSKDETIKQLNSALASKDPLLNSGKVSAVGLLTRAAADEEKRLIEKELAQWKGLVAERDETIRSQTQTEKELRYEIAEFSKNRPSGSNARPRPGQQGVLGPDEPKNAEVIKFYEDLTNMIVPNIRQSKSNYLDLDEWTLTCIYTYVNTQSNITHSLNFSLRFMYSLAPDEAEPVTSKDQLVRSARYTPLELDKEPEDLVERLGYLSSTFLFERDQLPLFLRSVDQKIGEALSPEEEEASEAKSDDDIEVIDD